MCDATSRSSSMGVVRVGGGDKEPVTPSVLLLQLKKNKSEWSCNYSK